MPGRTVPSTLTKNSSIPSSASRGDTADVNQRRETTLEIKHSLYIY
jgi:hypothetical protein